MKVFEYRLISFKLKYLCVYIGFWSCTLLKKKGTLPNLPKRFGRFEKACKCVESSEKRIKKSTKLLKDIPVCSGEDPVFLETFLSSIEQKKGFVDKYETWKVSY